MPEPEVNPIARQLGGKVPPSKRGKGNVVRRRVPIYRRKWFAILAIICLVTGVTAMGVVMAILAPLREQAETFDLADLHKIEKASLIYDRRGDELGRIFVLNRTPIKFEQVPLRLIDALTAQEDERFFRHKGVDMVGVVRAMYLNYKAGEETQGASTITQQLARDAFKLKELEKAGDKNARYTRKIVEWFIAERIEEKYTKSEILEMYLNRIFFGRNFYGIQAAAQGYFGKDVKDLSLEESALICGIIKSPNNLEPLRYPDRAKKARDHVLDRMREEGLLSKAEAEQYKAMPVVTNPPDNVTRLSHVTEEIRQQAIGIIGEEAAQSGGFHIYATVDAKLQRAVEASVRQRLSEVEQRPGYTHQTYELYHQIKDLAKKRIASKEIPANTPIPAPQYLQAAALVIDNHDGSVLAMVGGRDFLDSMFNRALQTRRPTGTAFLPFVYAAAFEKPQYYPPGLMEDKPINNRLVMIGGFDGRLGEWGTEQEETVYGDTISLRESLVQSRTAATARLGLEIGLPSVKDLVARAGIKSPVRDYPSSFLGVSEAKLDEMVLAYSTFPNKGKRPKELTLIHRITDDKGKVIYQIKEDEEPLVPVMDEIAAYQTHSCLVEALDRGTGRPARDEFGLKDFPAAGKTGTAYEFKDLWFLGYTSSVTCGVWCGFDQQKPIYEGAFSNRIALPIWSDAMNAASKDYKTEEIAPPQEAQLVEICNKSGLRAVDSCYEKVPDTVNGGMKAVRCTHREVIRPGSNFETYCNVHRTGGPGLASMLIGVDVPQETVPMNPAAFNVPSVRMKGLTVIGNDPYNAELPVLRAEPVDESGEVVPRAVPVMEEEGQPQSPIKLAPPPPLKLD
ncbi:penicillin-binding protein 1A [Roseimicrobium gellanilyticum]|uniref:Penicillin-binding protein 1A n=1 Tax=Roseimicrobium gellanilyticum TaxID=748857 RepID=A0A366H7X1_9BACT|nr:transglycosylase domain-containing protein [Roseimicrobium gellanilyticum]RBP37410.1 penicillin-binding protein 1A [Roseimicrobium gellanilyticum]